MPRLLLPEVDDHFRAGVSEPHREFYEGDLERLREQREVAEAALAFLPRCLRVGVLDRDDVALIPLASAWVELGEFLGELFLIPVPPRRFLVGGALLSGSAQAIRMRLDAFDVQSEEDAGDQRWLIVGVLW